MERIKIKCLAKEGALLPQYQTRDSAGADIRAFLTSPLIIEPGERSLVPTGLSFEIPSGYEVQVRPRSGLAIKNGITCLNAPGTIDADYRGEVKVILYNAGKESFTVNNGDRIAQIVVAPVTAGVFEKVAALSDTERGAGGFGSTGK
ncbi:MAG: dUTP diphosphatase [Treponemataceae bacterium]|nr:dUTP diphosphatase [Treponemataceae bacterium]